MLLWSMLLWSMWAWSMATGIRAEEDSRDQEGGETMERHKGDALMKVMRAQERGSELPRWCCVVRVAWMIRRLFVVGSETRAVGIDE